MITALVAAVAMVVSDVLGTCMVMAEARAMGWTAGLLDMLGWYVSIATTTISVTTLGGHDLTNKIYVLTFVGLANIFGTKLGQLTGSRFLKTKAERLIAAAARSGR
jgi:hypothetical protein